MKFLLKKMSHISVKLKLHFQGTKNYFVWKKILFIKIFWKRHICSEVPLHFLVGIFFQRCNLFSIDRHPINIPTSKKHNLLGKNKWIPKIVRYTFLVSVHHNKMCWLRFSNNNLFLTCSIFMLPRELEKREMHLFKQMKTWKYFKGWWWMSKAYKIQKPLEIW